MLRPQFIFLWLALIAGALWWAASGAARRPNLAPSTLSQCELTPIDIPGIENGSEPEDPSRSTGEQTEAAEISEIVAAAIGTTRFSTGLSPPATVDERAFVSERSPQNPESIDRGDRPEISLASISPGDAELLRQLPPVCTAGIDGLSPVVPIPDHSQFLPPARHFGDGSGEAVQVSATLPFSEPAGTQDQPHPEPAPVVEALPEGEPSPHPGLRPSSDQDSPPAEESDLGRSLLPPPGPSVDPHAELYARTQFPSAAECATCHQQIYDEWASSSHAYASISPMFNRFEDTINKLTQGTIGYFCMRCHAPVATIMEHPRDRAIYDGPRVFREGVTCVACHRVREAYTKTNGERRIEPGDIFQPVYSAGDGSGNELAILNKDIFKVKTSDADGSAAQSIHARSIHFEQMSQSDFCMSCHQVAVPPGIKLEVVWDQYRASPAYRAGVTCQDCHMGKVPGVNAGYSIGPAAVVSNRVVNPNRKHSNHAFYGPGSTIAHPGLFPQDARLDRWSPDQWLEFDVRAGWGTESFERQVAAEPMQFIFPPTWSNVDDRYDARELIDANLKKLQYKNDLRRQVMENGSKLDGPFFVRPPQAGASLEFEYCLTNLNPGHNMPSGSLGAQPQLWLNVVLTAPDGQPVWESGYLDSQGDLADIQSQDVLCGAIPFDRQLFNLQTKFLTTNVKGTDREMCLPINVDVDQLPFIRPAPQPVSVINHPPLIRMEAHSLPPTGSRRAKYAVPADCVQAPGIYRLSVRLRSRMEPIYFMRFCGATPEMMQSMNETILDVHPYTVAFKIE